MNTLRKRGWWGLLVAAVLASLTVSVAPANAAPRDDAAPAETCWVDTDTDAIQCFDDEAELEAAVLEQTGGEVIRQEEAPSAPARRSASGFGTLAVYAIADFFVDSNYGGTAYLFTTGSSTICTTGTGKLGNFTGATNNTISSWHAYLSCVARVYDGANQTGTSYGAYANAATIGNGMNDKASSYKLT